MGDNVTDTYGCDYNCGFTGSYNAVETHEQVCRMARKQFRCGNCRKQVTNVKLVDADLDYCRACYITHMENEFNPGTRKFYTKDEAELAWAHQKAGNRKNVIKRKKRTSKKKPSKKRPYKKRTSKKRKSKKRKSKKK